MKDQIVTPELSRQRLLAIADHLDKPQQQLHCDTFSFTSLCEITHCGTSGCAMGEAPVIFPEHYAYPKLTDEDGVMLPYLKGDGRSVGFTFPDFLGITQYHANFLFYPVPYKDELQGSGVIRLKGSATKEEVAANIRRYVKAFLPEPEPAA